MALEFQLSVFSEAIINMPILINFSIPLPKALIRAKRRELYAEPPISLRHTVYPSHALKVLAIFRGNMGRLTFTYERRAYLPGPDLRDMQRSKVLEIVRDGINFFLFYLKNLTGNIQ